MARARALVVLLLALYLCCTPVGDPTRVLSLALFLSCSLLGYAVHITVGHLWFWMVICAVSPVGQKLFHLLLNTLPPSLEAFDSMEGWVALGLFFGVSRLLGFGGSMPLMFSDGVAA